MHKTKAEAAEAPKAETPKPTESAEAPKAEAPKAEAPKAEAPKPTESAEAPKAEAPKPTESAEAPKPTESAEAPKAEAPKPTESAEAPKPSEVEALQTQVAELKNQLQSAMDRLEAHEREARQAQRLKKAGIPEALGAFIRDDADLESLNAALAALSKPTAAPTPTLPTVGTGNPGGKVMSVDELLVAAEANNDREALSRLKLAKLAGL